MRNTQTPHQSRIAQDQKRVQHEKSNGDSKSQRNQKEEANKSEMKTTGAKQSIVLPDETKPKAVIKSQFPLSRSLAMPEKHT